MKSQLIPKICLGLALICLGVSFEVTDLSILELARALVLLLVFVSLKHIVTAEPIDSPYDKR